MRYGLPYKGSKNKIAQWVIDNLPSAKHFYDLFAGGCAVTHCALLSGKFDDFLANDITDVPRLFLDAIHGKYKDETRWISREDFARLKDSDYYVRNCWSFGNNERDYLYGKDGEDFKRILWSAIVLGDSRKLEENFGVDCAPFAKCKSKEERKAVWKKEILAKDKRVEYIGHGHFAFKSEFGENFRLNKCLLDLSQSLQNLERIQNLQRLESLERIQNFQSLEKLRIAKGNYDKIRIKPDSVIYCDIPYKDCSGYSVDFNHRDFYDWAESQKELVVISEYDMPAARFERVAKIEKRQTFNGNGSGKEVLEGLFVPKSQVDLYKRLMRESVAQSEFEF